MLDDWPNLVKSDFQKAFEGFERSRDLFRELGDEPEAGAADIWAAQMLPDLGKIEEGKRRLDAIIAGAKRRGYQILLPPAYYWLGIGDYGRSGLSQTNRNVKTALRLAEETGNGFEAGHARDSLALYYSDLGELEPALAYASTMFSGADSDYRSPRQVWREHGTLARIALKLNLRATSLSFEKERLGIVRENWPDSILMNGSLRNILDAADSKGDFEGALRYAGESLRLALARGDKPENARAVAELYLSLGDLKSRAGDCAGSLADYDRALELYGRLPEVSANLYQLHKGRLLCFRRLEQRKDFESELRAVMKLSEEYRASIREDSSRQAFFTNEQDVFDAAAAHALEAQDARAAFSYVEKSRARSLLEFVESDKSVKEVEADFASVARPLLLGEIQSSLPEQVQLVQYAVLPGRVAVWVLTKTRFELVERKISADEVEKKVEDYRAAVLKKDSGETLKRAARELYDLLVPAGLDSSKQLCIVPDKSLHRLPFASLVSPSGKYLLEEFALSYAPSASVLVHATENARRRAQSADENVLSVGDPDFDREENPNLSGLQSAADEAKLVARLYTRPLELSGAGATKEAFLRDFTGAQVIHFAGHFIANRRSPANSKLLFAGGDLRSSELGDSKLPRAKLVVLSACETGVERYDKSEGAIGIARTFLALGAPVVVASGWKVDSDRTRDLMVAFHRNRRESKLTSAESLRRAQLELLSHGETNEPFYWAAFSLFGGYASY